MVVVVVAGPRDVENKSYDFHWLKLCRHFKYIVITCYNVMYTSLARQGLQTKKEGSRQCLLADASKVTVINEKSALNTQICILIKDVGDS